MTTSAQLRSLFIAALTGATDAGASVFSPFDWPTAQDAYPAILVRAPRERKRSLGRNAPLFEVTTTIEVVARTKAVAQVGDAGSAEALAAVEAIKGQIEVALINNPSIWFDTLTNGQRIQQFASIESDMETSSDGDMPLAELRMHIEVEFMQDANDFHPVPSTPLQEVTAAVSQPPGTVEPGFILNFSS